MSTQQLPNPNIYLNYFSPEDAAQFEVSRNLSLATLGAIIWDILIYLADDIKIVRRRPFHPVTLCFVFSRLFALTFVVLSTLQHTRPNNCMALGYGLGVFCILAMGTTSFLILSRALAVYWDNKRIKVAFSLLWLASCGVMSVTLIGGDMGPLAETGYCVDTVVEQYTSASAFVWFFFDALVFVAVSYNIYTFRFNVDERARGSWGTIITGRALPRISRAFLQGGQQYFLLVALLNLPIAILMVLPNATLQYKLMFGYPGIGLSASMACRALRNMRMYDTHERGASADHSLSNVQFTIPSVPRKAATTQLAIGRTPATRNQSPEHVVVEMSEKTAVTSFSTDNLHE